MTTKRLSVVDDLGSMVVKHLVDQSNRASVTVTTPLAQNLEGDGAFGAIVFATANANAGVFFTAVEDCLITSLKLMSLGTVGLDAAAPNTSFLVILRVPALYANETGAKDQVVPAVTGIHGNNNTVLGNANVTYELVYASDATLFTAALGFDIGQWGELVGKAVAGTVAADAYNATFIAQDHAATTAKSISPNGFHMQAGDSLVWGIVNNAGADVSLMFSVTFRPIKDEIVLLPDAPKLTTTSTRDR